MLGPYFDRLYIFPSVPQLYAYTTTNFINKVNI